MILQAVLLVLILFNGVPESIDEIPQDSPEACATEVSRLMQTAEVTDPRRKLVAACMLTPTQVA